MKANLRMWVLVVFVASAMLRADAEDRENEFKDLFDGHTLAGWETPDQTYWEVEEGAIVGRITKEHPCTVNQYLVWAGGDLADFELKLKSRLRGEGGINNGFQFRSRLLPDHDICGYQMDNNLQTPWLVRLYDEYGRHTLAWRGERTVFAPDGSRTTTKLAEVPETPWFRLEEWHEYHLTCVGPRITLEVDGRLAAEVLDHDARRFEPQGVLALQLHSGAPTTVEFKDIQLKILKNAASKPAPVLTDGDRERKALRGKAAAWWQLDVGGHGALPRLVHIPAFEKFELNVRSAGAGSRPDTDVVLLDGAYFDAGPELHGGDEAITVYLRVRDPRGLWEGGLFTKGGASDSNEFRLFAATPTGASGPEIVFETRTENGASAVRMPVSKMEATAWHDLAGRYDGRTLELFCDGVRMAGIPCTGRLLRNQEPLLLGAEVENGKASRFFHGEIQEAGLWRRALSVSDLRLLSRKEPQPSWERTPGPK